MENNDKNTQEVKILKPMIFNFNKSYEIPDMKYNPKRGLVEWGKDNNYPQYPLDLYNFKGSTTHKAIINKKVKLISGQGFEQSSNTAINDFIKKNKLDFEVYKATLDYELFNGYAFEVIYDREGINIKKIKHVPFHKLRIGIECEELPDEHYWYSDNWNHYKKDMYKPKYIRKWDKSNPGGRQLYYYTEYNPESDGLYPISGYSTSFNWIEMDYEISQFHLNQVKQGYSPSFILNFATGIPTEEEQDAFFRKFKKEYSGAENSGKIIITYSEGADGVPTLTPISLNDSDKRFTMLIDQIERNIVMGAEIPAAMVILTPGKLGSTDERKELLQEFQMSYVSPRQVTLEDSLNEILDATDITLKKYEM